MSLLFIDAVCNKPYDPRVLKEAPLGGTEATVIRVIEGLNALGLDASCEQHNRQTPDETGSYWPMNSSVDRHDLVVCLRDPKSLIEARKRFKDSKLVLWTHDLANRDFGALISTIIETKAEVVCVSEFHKTQTLDVLKVHGYTGQFKVHRIYNPIADDLFPDHTIPYDPNKLVFFSSPHKGLEYAINTFNILRSFHSDFKLYIANPGYLLTRPIKEPNVVDLGPLPHHEVLNHARTSLCTYYPNTVFPETFGLVYAESNAIGTPVVTHRLGASSEVLDHPSQFVNCFNKKELIDRVLSWHNGSRPNVHGGKLFRLSRVLRDWRKLLDNWN